MTDLETPTDRGADAGDLPDSTVLTVTEDARAYVLDLRAKEDDPEGLALRIEVTGARGIDYVYDLSFQAVSDAEPDDHVGSQGTLAILVPADSIDKLQGATLDLPSVATQPGLVLRNPNRPELFDTSSLELSGDVPERIRQLLVQQINPALASHGGFAELVGVEGSKAFVTMGGGCQGCAMSRMTLTEGIASSIKDAIPEIDEVVDVTDHQAGDNPYYS